MKNFTTQCIVFVLLIGFIACSPKTKNEESSTQKIEEASTESDKPSDADLMAFKVFHHMRYMVTTAAEAGGTNKLLHTKKMPTEGSDPVVTPALDHLYSKAVIDLSEGPVTVEYPNDIDDRYWSIHITDQEHYTIFDEIKPVGKYTFVRNGKDMDVSEGATVINCPGDYPHLFIRIQVKTADDMVNTLAVQERIKLEGISKELTIDNYIKHTIETHDVYPQNKETLEASVNFTKEDYLRVSAYVGAIAPKFGVTGNIGMFDAIDSEEPNSNDPEYRAAALIWSPWFTSSSRILWSFLHELQ